MAALLARRGVSVALIDRDTFPRDKLCGEFLSYDALPILDRLGVLAELDRQGGPKIEDCEVVGRRRSYRFDFPRPARGVSRLLLDSLLKNAAIEAGARDFTGWTAVKTGEIERNGERRTLDAKVVIGAWGRWGRFDAQLNRAFVRDTSHRHFGFKRHYRFDRDSDDGRHARRSTISLFSFRDGYLGVNAIEGGMTNVCGLVHATRLKNHKGRWESFVQLIREEERSLDVLFESLEPAQDDFLSSEPVIFRPRSPVEGGVLMIGDASGIVDPLTGNGMAMGVQSALVAAPHVMRLLEAPRDRERIENAYRAGHSAFFAARIRWSRRLAQLLSRPLLLNGALSSGIRSPRLGAFFVQRTRADEAALGRMADSWLW